MSVLSIHNGSKTYGDVRALSGITLDVDKGETVAIIGPSGCGKSTLLRCLGLFDRIENGEIHLHGNPVITANSDAGAIVHMDSNDYHARVGMVFQNLNVWPHLKVLSNLTLAPQKVRGADKREIVERARQLLAQMGVHDKVDDYPQTLSGGQLQRVALARAMMMDPEVLLLDEITSALDPELVGEVLETIAELSSNGMTMVIVTHEMQFASEVANRVVFMDEGKSVEVGTPHEILSSPSSLRLKQFLERIIRHRGNGDQT